MLWLFAPSLLTRGSGYPNTSVHRFMNTPAALRQRHGHAVRHTAFLIFMRGLVAAGGLLGAAGMNAQTGTALVRHAPSLSGSVDGSVQQMTGEPVSLNGGAAISGDLLVPGLPVVT